MLLALRWIGESSFGKQIVGECMEWIAGFRGRDELRGPQPTKQNQKIPASTKTYKNEPKVKLLANAWEWIAGFRGLNSTGPISCFWVKNTPRPLMKGYFWIFWVVWSGHKSGWSYAKHWSIKAKKQVELGGCMSKVGEMISTVWLVEEFRWPQMIPWSYKLLDQTGKEDKGTILAWMNNLSQLKKALKFLDLFMH